MTSMPAKRGRGRPRKPRPEAAETITQKKGPKALPFAAQRKVIAAELERVTAPSSSVPAATRGDLIPAGSAGDVAHLPVQIPGLRFALNDEQRAAAQENIAAFAKHGVTGLADNTRRGMLGDWLNWLAYCQANDLPVLPVEFDPLRGFLDALMDAGRKRATVEHHLYTLRRAAKFYGCPDPMDSEVAKAYWKDACRTRLVAAKRQAEGLRADDVERLVAGLDPDVPKDARDAALVRMGYDLMARRNELAEARWEDLDLPARGYGRYRVPRSKTDQEGEGTVLALGRATVDALLAWRRHARPELPFVFQPMKPRRYTRGPNKGELIIRPLDAGEIPIIWNRLAVAAGLDADRRSFSGHSARVGGAQDITAGGGSVALLMKLGRWKSPAQPARYGEAGLADEALAEREQVLANLKNKTRG